jgi:hypothetical protein
VRLAIGLAVALLAAAVAAGCGGPSENAQAPTQRFASRPDLAPPVVHLRTRTAAAGPGYVFLAPKRNVAQVGPMILDTHGRLVWFEPLDVKVVTDFRVQTYAGKPVLTWWRGRSKGDVGNGFYVIMDDTYNRIATVHGGNGLPADVHEFLITPWDTALITVYERRTWDLSSVGGPRHGSIFDGVVQEVDIGTGKVLFEWKSSDHVALSESYEDVPPPTESSKAPPYDYFHVNSIDLEPDGNLLVSARNTHAVYEISRADGSVLWRLGGTKSDFAMGAGTAFAWQHDARRQPDGTVTLFDNGGGTTPQSPTRVLRLSLDTEARTARLVRSWSHPTRLRSGSQGNAELLPDGRLFVGWGAQPWFTEFGRDGTVLLDGHFGGGAATESYRVYLAPWTGHPGGRPALAVTRGRDELTLRTSWNGATLVERWQLLAGPRRDRLEVVTTVPDDGFETTATLATDEPFVAVRALDAHGTILGTSAAVAVADAPAS